MISKSVPWYSISCQVFIACIQGPNGKFHFLAPTYLKGNMSNSTHSFSQTTYACSTQGPRDHHAFIYLGLEFMLFPFLFILLILPSKRVVS